MEVSLNKIPPRVFVPFLHKHRETEELHYICIQAKAGSMPDADIHDGQRVEGHPRWPKT